LVGVGVIILIMVIAWEVIQINSGLNSNINQIVVGMPRENIFTTNLEQFLSDKSILQSGLPN